MALSRNMPANRGQAGVPGLSHLTSVLGPRSSVLSPLTSVLSPLTSVLSPPTSDTRPPKAQQQLAIRRASDAPSASHSSFYLYTFPAGIALRLSPKAVKNPGNCAIDHPGKPPCRRPSPLLQLSSLPQRNDSLGGRTSTQLSSVRPPPARSPSLLPATHVFPADDRRPPRNRPRAEMAVACPEPSLR